MKWHGYFLDEDGHGPEWREVFRVAPSQSAALWEALVAAALTAQVTEVRASRFGIGCATRVELTYNGARPRSIAWFFELPDDPPRLVTGDPAP